MHTKNLKVRTKLTLAFGTLAGTLLLVSALAAHSLKECNDGFASFVGGVNARLLLSYEVRVAIERRAIGARELGFAATPEERQTVYAEVSLAEEDVKRHMGNLVGLASAPGVPDEVRRLISKMAEVEKSYEPVALSIVDLAMNGKAEEAIRKINVDCRPLLAELNKAANDYRDFTVQRSGSLVEQAAADYASQRNMLIAACLFSFASAAVAGLLITRSLTRSLGAEPDRLGEIAQQVASGNLTTVSEAPTAIAGSVLASLCHMQQSLSAIVFQVRSGSDSIATGSSQIALANSDLSQRTEEQASNLQQTAASMEEISGTVQSSSVTAGEAKRLAADAAAAAEAGGKLMGIVVSVMREISSSSQRITDIIGVIDVIAFQTNILALNAAVEAARAGEQGRGFAVVASEVRTLAHRSAEAAKEIKQLISASSAEVKTGAQRVDEAGASMSGIVAQVSRVSQLIAEISASSGEQAKGVSQIGDAVQQLDHVTQQNAALVEETAAAAESLRHQAERLTAAVSVFTVE